MFFGSEPFRSAHRLRNAPDSHFGENFDVSGVRNHFSGAKVIKTHRKRFPWVCSSMFEYVQVCSEYVRVCSTTLHDARWSDSDPGILKKYLWNHCIVIFSTFHGLRSHFLLFIVCDAVVVGDVLCACRRHGTSLGWLLFENLMCVTQKQSQNDREV